MYFFAVRETINVNENKKEDRLETSLICLISGLNFKFQVKNPIYRMKLEEHSSTNLFSSGGTSFVVLLNLFVTCYNVIEHDFGAFLSMKLVEDWVQVFFFEVLQESVTSLSRKLIILSLPRDIISVRKRLRNKNKK